MKNYDAIVLGAGGAVGSAAMCHLAQRGVRVLGLDRFVPPHDQGSSHGQTRVIRQAYFEHADYTPLLQESYRLWEQLESRVGNQLYHEVGVLQVGPADGKVVPGVLHAAKEHALKVDRLTPAAIQQRWPGFQVPDDFVGVFEQQAGYLMVEKCVKAQVEVAQLEGANGSLSLASE